MRPLGLKSSTLPLRSHTKHEDYKLFNLYRGLDKLLVQLGIYPTRFLSIAFLKKQLLKIFFHSTYIFKITYL